MRITLKNECPYCASHYFVRIPRKTYMRFSSAIKYYECDLCRQEFLVIERKHRFSPEISTRLIPIQENANTTRGR